ncbi:MAG: hypothetical protein RR365_10800 [Bacteroides sp.]
MFVIEDITNYPEDVRRTDGRYPSRIGSTVEVASLKIGSPMLLEYTKDKFGNPKSGCLITSKVQDWIGIFTEGKDDLAHMCSCSVRTHNSVYYLKKI